MPKRPLPSGPLVCARRFEPSRLQQQFWQTAYQQVVPAGTTTGAGPPRWHANAPDGATPAGKTIHSRVSADTHPRKGVCA